MALDACDAYAASGSSHGILQRGGMPCQVIALAPIKTVSAGQGQDVKTGGKEKQKCLPGDARGHTE